MDFPRGCLVSSLEEARNNTVCDGNGRKAGYKVNRYETTTQQHPTFRLFTSAAISRRISFSLFSSLSGRFFNLSFFISLSRCVLDSFGRIMVDPPLYATRATFRHDRSCTKRCPVVSNYSDTFIFFYVKFYTQYEMVRKKFLLHVT